MAPDVIVRQAAQAALASDHPVRVVEDGKLIGIVDDDAILRVVVAEEETPA
jgi:glycine betaine/proline transport system ATP-binding protein